MRALPFIVVALLLLPPALAAQAPPTLTKTEVRTESPAAINHRVRAATWGMFQRADHRRTTPPTLPLDDIRLETRPRATHVPSLCRYDSVVVEFAPIDHVDRGPDTRTRAIGLTATQHFRFLAPPAGGFAAMFDRRLRATEGPCVAISTNDGAFFRAEDEQVATDGFRAFLNARAAAAATPASIAPCSRPIVESRSCAAILAALEPGEIDTIERCEAANPAIFCYRITLYDRRLTVRVSSGYGDSDHFGDVAEARLEWMIVMSHVRPD